VARRAVDAGLPRGREAPRRREEAPAPRPLPRPADAGVVVATNERTHGYLVVNSTPWARVLIDGKDSGRTTPITPRARVPLKRGRHRVTLVVGDQGFDFAVEITPGATTRLIEALPISR